MNRVYFTMVSLAMALLIPSIASAKKGPGGFRLGQIERAAESLGIEAETVSQIKKIMYDGRRTGVDLRANLEKAKIDLHERLNQRSPNRAEVMTSIERLGALKTKAKKHRVGIMLSIRALLTPEQQKGLRKLMKEKRGRRKGKRRGKRGPEQRSGAQW
jgi:Spy/CpxP family protein refolding chaperone